jgi:TonB family protein
VFTFYTCDNIGRKFDGRNRMRVIPLLILMFVSMAAATRAQTTPELPSAQVVWERYRIDKHDISVLFPKLPTAHINTNSCSEVDRRSYRAYTDGAIYGVSVVAKTKSSSFCTRVERFTSDLFEREITRFRTEMAEISTATQDKYGHRVYKFSKPDLSFYVYDDSANKRWVEVSIFHRKDAKLIEDFLDSVLFESKEGKSIRDGADVTLGDPTFQSGPVTDKSNDKAATEPLVIVSKPRAAYTNEARQANETGTVRLKVTLHANGSVGSVTPVTTLKYGLTEQAIAAAKKVVFLPKRIGGLPVSVTMTFEYNFSIY